MHPCLQEGWGPKYIFIFKSYLSNTRSLNVWLEPLLRLLKLANISLTHSTHVYSRRIPASAMASTKLASSTVSPASASARRMPEGQQAKLTIHNAPNTCNIVTSDMQRADEYYSGLQQPRLGNTSNIQLS